MNSYIKNLRSKPEDARKRVMIITLAICMSVVVFVWVSSLGNKFSQNVVAKEDSVIKPFTLFADSIGSTYDKLSASAGDVPSIEEATAGKQINLVPIER
ncbi:MAG: hypothetical protein AAB477_02905 [Patescibacteria group bacterium]